MARPFLASVLLLAAQPAWGDRTMPRDAAPHDPETLADSALGAKVVDSIMGDLTGEGHNDALLVVDPAPMARAGTRRPLEVMLMRRDGAGRLRKVATNARLLACGPCAASPGYICAEPGAFTIVEPGEAAAYRFAYDRIRGEWFVAAVSRPVADLRMGGIRRQELTARELGRIAFSRFDPARLPLPQEETR